VEVSTLLVGWGWSFKELKAGWQEIEALGFDACYMGDDLFPHYFDDDPANAQANVEVYDPWTILPVMADTTSRMRIGSLVSPAGRRHPALFAKMTSIVDNISGGRLTVSLGAGNAPDQRAALGEPLLKGAERAARLAEEVRIMDALWREEKVTLEGEYYTVKGMVSSPKPVSRPRPEIQIAFKSKKFLTRLSAEMADRVNLIGADDVTAREALDALRGHCNDVGRDYDSIRKGRLCAVLLTEQNIPEVSVEQVLIAKARELGRDPRDLLDEHNEYVLSYVGPAAGCAEALAKRTLEMGINEVVMCPDTIAESSYANTMRGLRRFAEEVMPALKRL
jgi:alkanesulfonate monooxygenase SsuD/methylene tetrahydromethanopterin reductase-like flavin-dependent oxidoreductase (luciferase family)